MKQLSFFVPFGKRKFSDFVLDLHKPSRMLYFGTGTLNCDQFLFLSLAHVLQQPKHFFISKIFKLKLALTSLRQVKFVDKVFTVFVQDSKRTVKSAVAYFKKSMTFESGKKCTPVLGKRTPNLFRSSKVPSIGSISC